MTNLDKKYQYIRSDILKIVIAMLLLLILMIVLMIYDSTAIHGQVVEGWSSAFYKFLLQ